MKTIALVEKNGELVPAKAPPADVIKTSIDIENRTMTVWQAGDTLPIDAE